MASRSNKRARWYCYKCYAELDVQEHNKPAAFSRGFQLETMEQLWRINKELEAVKEEVKQLRYYHAQNTVKAQRGGASLTN
jgi:hypothetical protein